MDYLKKLTELVSKYRWAVLILMVGVVLMLIPASSEEPQPQLMTTAPAEKETVGEQLQTILGQIKGVGKVQVLLTVDTGANTVYQTDGDKTVIVTGADRTQNGLVERVESPVFRGAVIVCQGADSPTVRLSVVEAVSAVTGLGTDRITVVKMK